MIIRYWIEDHSGTFEDAFNFDTQRRNFFDHELLAEEVAEDYHSNHDGWEASWPLVFTLAYDSGKIIGRFSVERETRPDFSAMKLAEAKHD